MSPPRPRPSLESELWLGKSVKGKLVLEELALPQEPCPFVSTLLLGG